MFRLLINQYHAAVRNSRTRSFDSHLRCSLASSAFLLGGETTRGISAQILLARIER